MTYEEIVNDFYSLAPKYRTKKRLIKMLKDNAPCQKYPVKLLPLR